MLTKPQEKFLKGLSVFELTSLIDSIQYDAPFGLKLDAVKLDLYQDGGVKIAYHLFKVLATKV